MASTKINLSSLLNTDKELDIYKQFNEYSLIDLARSINSLLDNKEELENIREHDHYRENVTNLAQFIYTKYLAERDYRSAEKQKRESGSLLSRNSLQTIYNLAT